MKKLTIRVNNSYCDLLIANTALNLYDAYTVMVGLEPIPLIKLLENSEVELVTSIGNFRLIHKESIIYIDFNVPEHLHHYLEANLDLGIYLPYLGVSKPNIINNYDFYNKFIDQSY